MKHILFGLLILLGTTSIFAQHQVYVGGSLGTGYANNRHKTTNLNISCVVGSPECNANNWLNIRHNMAAQLKLYALYGYKKFRVGMQLDYLYAQPLSNTFSYTPSQEIPSNRKYTTLQLGPQYVGSSLLVEATAFQKGIFSISPTISLGYTRKLEDIEVNNYLTAGTSLLFGFQVKEVTFYVAPDYSLRYGKTNYEDGYNNSEIIDHSILLTLGVRGDVLAKVLRK